MKILAIETSCDETAISILDTKGGLKNPRFEILSNIVSSQVKIHAKWGGVVPSLAKREHIKNLPVVFKKALSKAKIKPEKINLIAVTRGPGLEPTLWTGINFAKELAEKWNKPLMPINHMEGHLFSVFLKNRKENFQFTIFNLQFPTVALLVSGGHTQLILVKDLLKYKLLGETRDDAAGEAFDKAAKMLNLGYPGGPIISSLASNYRSLTSIVLPRPMINDNSLAGKYNFSFSGLKTALLYKIKEIPKLTLKIKKELCYEFQQAIIDVLISKTIKAAKEFKARTIILGGGVAANKELRNQMKESVKEKIPNSRFLIPDSIFCGDNAAMIALAAYSRYKKKRPANKSLRGLKANGNLKIA